MRTHLSRPALPLALALAAVLGAFPPAARTAPLTDLAMLPVRIIPGGLVGGGGAYTLFADVSGGGLQQITQTSDVWLGAQPPLHPTPGRGRFVIRIHARDTLESDLRINLVTTDKRCMLTTVDQSLTQGSQPGRQIEITPVLSQLDGVHFPRFGSISTICTGDAGQMVLYLASPSFDMLELTAISVDSAGYGAAVYIVMLPLPTSKLTGQTP